MNWLLHETPATNLLFFLFPHQLQVLNDQTFAIMVMMALFTTFITTPTVMAVYKPARKAAPYKHRTIQRRDLDTELRMLACFHSTRNIPTIINLIESSRGIRKRGRLCIYAMHLMELSERSSAISMVHKARSNGLPFWNKKADDQDQTVIAFEAYGQLRSVTVRPMTAISSLDNIHEDICTSAHQKRVAMILIPFHKHQRLDGSMESLGHAFHAVNQRVLRHAPCSVGILVDRGLGGTTQVAAREVSFKVVVPFFGGRDDREALAYGMRLAEHPGIMLKVVKFAAPPGKSLAFGTPLIGISAHKKQKKPKEEADDDRDREEEKEDDLCLSEFRKAFSDKDESMPYEEKLVQSKEEVVDSLKDLNKVNLFFVGRTPPIARLIDRSDCPELGPVGSFLASSEFSTTASVVVVQQYYPEANLHPLVEEQANYAATVPDTPVTAV